MSWKNVKLENLGTIVRGSSPRPQGDKRYYGGTVPRLMIEDLTRDGKYVTPHVDSLTEEGAKLSRPMKKGELVITVSGRTGVPAILNVNACIHDGFVGFRDLSDEVNIDYLYNYLSSLTIVTSQQAVGAIFKNLTTEQLKNIIIPLPPLPIQKRIAEILDAADALRRKDKELLRKYDELTQAIFIDMFGDPVKNEKGWEVKKLVNEFTSIRYGTSTPPKYSEKGIPFLRATNVKAGRIEKKGMVFLYEIEGQKISKCFVNEGDLIIVRSGANTGDCAYISEEYANCLAGYDLIVEMDKVKSRFYNYFLNSAWGKAIIDKLSRRAGQPHLNSEQVSNIECIAPDYTLLEKFKIRIDSIEKLRSHSIETNKVNLNLFNSLLQQAFKGELVK